jgi:mevalonate kinase
MTTATAFSPGSINVLGEHSLVFANDGEGGSGIRLAVNRFLKVTITERHHAGISVTGRLGAEEGMRDALSNKFIRAALEHYGIADGVAITIDDNLPETVGLGSSAALSVALTQALSRYRDGVDLGNDDLFLTAREITRTAQDRLVSGIDIAGSVYTGLVALDAKALTAERLPMPPAVSVLYSGTKTPTPEVLARVRDQGKPGAFFDEMDALTKTGINHARNGDWQAFGRVMNDFQAYMVELGLTTPELDDLRDTLSPSPGVYGAKIAGAGLGDSVIAVGREDHRMDVMDHAAFVDVRGYSYDTAQPA